MGGFRYLAIKLGAGALLPALMLSPVSAQTVAEGALSAFNVTPLRVEIDLQAQFSTFQVRNESASKMAVQARSFAWSQAGGEDRYAPTGDIIVSPAIVEIEPGATQFFKLLKRPAAGHAGEASYRLVIDQLPDAQIQKQGATNTRLRVSIPVFVGRNMAAPANLAWTLDAGQLLVSNGGGKSSKFGQMAIVTADGRSFPLASKGPRYALAGATVGWALPQGLPCLAEGAFVTGSIDNVPLREPIRQACE